MDLSSLYIEETFGILTDDDLYLDCVLVKPANLQDEDLQMLRVWVPRYPLTKSSVITCARQEAAAYGVDGKVAHLVFDLRGTGESEGVLGDKQFHLDLQAIKAWSKERFGAINFGFLGVPEDNARVILTPIRPSVVMETYYYPAASKIAKRPPLIYLATYGSFGRNDDALCLAFAQEGYDVYGIDPMRYLLHASADSRLTPATIWEDCRTLCATLPGEPFLIAQPISSGLGLLWASGVQAIQGIVAIGTAQAAFQPVHIFDNRNFQTFFLGRYVYQISPRPVALVQQEGTTLGGNPDTLAALLETCGYPRRLDKTPAINLEFLRELVDWLQAPT